MMVMKITTRIPTTEPTAVPITVAFELEEPEEEGFPIADCVGRTMGLECGVVGCKGGLKAVVVACKDDIEELSLLLESIYESSLKYDYRRDSRDWSIESEERNRDKIFLHLHSTCRIHDRFGTYCRYCYSVYSNVAANIDKRSLI